MGRILVSLIGGLFAALPALTALAQSAPAYPSRAIRIVVPFPPGGGGDLVARSVSQGLSESLGQTVLVDNRPGANGAVGSEVVAKSPADGYTLLNAGASTHVIHPLIAKLNYDPMKDFAPIGLTATTSFVVLVKPDNPALPVKTFAELLAYLKARPGQVNYASFGNGSTGHLAGEMFKSMTGVDMVHIPYKGAAPGLVDLMAGQISLMFSDMSGMPHVKAGKLRPLAVTGPRRLSSYPDIPTIAESGVPGYDVQGWFALFAPAATPRSIIDRLNAELVKVLGTPAVRNQLIGVGLEPAPSTPAQLAALMNADRIKWTKVIADAKLKFE